MTCLVAVTSHLVGCMLYISRVQDDPHESLVATASEGGSAQISTQMNRKKELEVSKTWNKILLFLSITQSCSDTEPELCLPYCWIKLVTEKMGRTTPFSPHGSTASEE